MHKSRILCGSRVRFSLQDALALQRKKTIMEFRKESLRICITRNRQSAYSETFIRNQIAMLSRMAHTFPLYSGRMPEREENGRLLYPLPVWLLHKIIKGITQKRNHYFSNAVLGKYLTANRIDIVLANFGMSAVHMLPVCRQKHIPLVPHFHGFDATHRKMISQYAARYKTLFAEAPAIIAVSHVMKEKLVALHAPENKVKVIPYGIDLSAFKPPAHKQDKEFTFLAVGRFTPKKAPLNTLKAFMQAGNHFPDAKLVMVGGKDGLFKECEKFVADNQLGSKVTFTGVLTSGEIAAYMQQANVFVQHSVTAANGDMEGTPLSILEASASGLPVISTLHGGIMEAVIHGRTGLLSAENDIRGMAENMMQLAGAPLLAKEMGIAARKHTEENYDLEKQSFKLFTTLKQAVNDYRGTHAAG